MVSGHVELAVITIAFALHVQVSTVHGLMQDQEYPFFMAQGHEKLRVVHDLLAIGCSGRNLEAELVDKAEGEGGEEGRIRLAHQGDLCLVQGDFVRCLFHRVSE